MFKAFEFCIPTSGTIVPAGPEWPHEIKYDGYRLRLERDGDRVRLITRGGYDWAKRYPWIVEAALMRRPAEALDQIEEPKSPLHGSGDGFILTPHSATVLTLR